MIRKYFTVCFFVASLWGGITSPAAAQEKQDLTNVTEKAENYLRGLDTLKADFIQTAYNGTRLSGTFYLNRPGKLRFEYNEVDDFIVADGLFIYFYDGELKEQTNAPIGQTLADFLLRKDISLRGDVAVQDIAEEGNYQTVTIATQDDPGAGQVRLFFQKEPYALYKWHIIDAAGLTTEISLHNIERDVDLPPNLFAYIKPKDDKAHYNQ